jgi:ribonucleoside-diphosphate reductase alpha chain
LGGFAVFVGHLENTGESEDWPQQQGKHPFEVWVNGAEQPRGLAALAKSLSMDMRSNDRGWLQAKLKSLMKAHGDDGFVLAMPPTGEPTPVPSLVSGFAKLVHYRCEALGAFEGGGPTPVLDALMSPKEPKTGTEGTLSWTVDINNPATQDDFVMGLKELTLPNGQRRPYSVWLSGEYHGCWTVCAKASPMICVSSIQRGSARSCANCWISPSRVATFWRGCRGRSASNRTLRPWRICAA